jgi:hypothetical protein
MRMLGCNLVDCTDGDFRDVPTVRPSSKHHIQLSAPTEVVRMLRQLQADSILAGPVNRRSYVEWATLEERVAIFCHDFGRVHKLGFSPISVDDLKVAGIESRHDRMVALESVEGCEIEGGQNPR